MKKSLFKIGIFALVMTMSGLFASATQVSQQVDKQVKSSTLPKVELKTFINPIHSESSAVVSISEHMKDQYSIPVPFADIYINNRLSEFTTDSEGDYSIASISSGSTLTFVTDGYQSVSIQITRSGTQQDVIMESLSSGN